MNGEQTIEETPVIILCGGRGARFDHMSQVMPKPLIKVAGKPMLGHIIDLFEQQGFRHFILLTGYMHESIVEFTDKLWISRQIHSDTRINVLDTGIDSQTGDRIQQAGKLIGTHYCVITYGDGLCDVKMSNVIEHHVRHRSYSGHYIMPKVTLTAVKSPGRFGVIRFEDEPNNDWWIKCFDEKANDWINGGFMVAEHDVIKSASCSWESKCLQELARDGELIAFKHEGFWMCMDTRRDLEQIEKSVLDNNGQYPWIGK